MLITRKTMYIYIGIYKRTKEGRMTVKGMKDARCKRKKHISMNGVYGTHLRLDIINLC